MKKTSGGKMGKLEEMLLKNGVIYRGPEGSAYIEGSILSNSLVVRNSDGWVTHKIEKSWDGVGLIVRNVSTGSVEFTIPA